MKRLVAIAALLAALGGGSALVLPGCSSKQLSSADAFKTAQREGQSAIDAARILLGQAQQTTAQLTNAGALNAVQAGMVRDRLKKADHYIDQAQGALRAGLAFQPQIDMAIEMIAESKRLVKGGDSI